MVKGMRDHGKLMSGLGVASLEEMHRLMQLVHAGWEIIGSKQNHARARGEALAGLDLLDSHLWSRNANTKDAKGSLRLVRTLLKVERRRGKLLGLTQKVIEGLSTISPEPPKFNKEVDGHARMPQIAKRMLELIAQRRNDIDVGPATAEAK